MFRLKIVPPIRRFCSSSIRYQIINQANKQTISLSTTSTTSTSKTPNHTTPKLELNKLAQICAQVIKITGPISLSAFMRLCLTHPELGYYTTRDPLGAKGDFVTSPEISQMFGEMIGIWLFTVWNSQKKPKEINLIEFGPGKGTLTFDVIKSFSKLVQTLKHEELKLNIILVETSPILKQVQHNLLSGKDLDTSKEFWEAPHKWNGKITWVDTEKDLWEVTQQQEANYILAHEFYDALPVSQFKKTEHGWREYMVDHNEDDGTFFLGLNSQRTPSSAIPETNPRYSSQNLDSIVEISSELHSYTSEIVKLLDRNKAQNGAALIVDYGPDLEIPGMTLRGIKNHEFKSPFEDLGEVDLSVDVDFGAIKESATSDPSCQIDVFGPVQQGDWLHQLGIQFRAEQLYNKAKNDEEREIIKTGYHRLVEKDDKSMGHIYKFMALLPKGGPIPVGFGGGVEE
ncbi:hypothetical protein BN7_349 [Wickerhamomyces ciferrii]|uniref:Protein arginine methyltransferase NDUFAF7 n=1 Tax=Wickerhamomyces ciferrii (strain ATCC 14091 / BCRC 22168 / CBS 111 / JCM 3599 / NBRC 0793 / NRRL Y-1031 F-60-10) TaxID=1206466 RepID=K0K7M7_WICCF|nr:uncharacterized protein BN7_349 [Wickerhamomyces ciferrii]CCH40815.1 hypothetical protein BN7_349 [Wickerhamomyces ciferrii]